MALPELKEDQKWAFAFENAMDSFHFGFHRGMRGKLTYQYDDRNVTPLLKAGYVTLKEVKDNQYYYQPTEAGIKWWIGVRYKYALESVAELKRCRLEPHYGTDPSALFEKFDGKGIGCQVEILTYHHNAAIFSGLKEGYFDFVHHRDYCGCPHAMEEYVTVALTAKGMAYFDALPKLVLECA